MECTKVQNGVSRTFTAPALIQKKRDGLEMTKEEIFYFVQSVVNEEATPAQLGAMCMAIFLRGMTRQETVDLTDAFIQSGEHFTWPKEWRHLVVDKHSTGGVGDKVSIPLVPALAACGLKVPMISGRGLGHTGGTLDKLESIPGFCVSQSPENVRHLMETIGCCIVGQTENLNPADKIFYSTRNDTSTVPCLPLVVASIISKKAVAGASALVLDVKFGEASFMKTKQEAKTLAQEMVNVSEGLGIKTTALLSHMDNPIGKAIGNALEIKESVRCLCGKGPKDLEQLVCAEGAVLLYSSGRVASVEEGERTIRNKLTDGSALRKFEEMLVGQGVKPNVAARLCERDGDVHRILSPARNVTEIRTPTSGYVKRIKAMDLAILCCAHGAGRTRAEDQLNMAVGLELEVSVGDAIEQGAVWARFHHDEQLTPEEVDILESAVVMNPRRGDHQKLIDSMISAE